MQFSFTPTARLAAATLAVQAGAAVPTTTFAGQESTGTWVSFTVTVKEQTVLLPLRSWMLYSTVVTPLLKVMEWVKG